MNAPHDFTPASTGVLRFITAGSVDDGKSTLIGRLLYDSKAIFADQLAAVARARHRRQAGDDIDLSLLTDGLEAEREQGITIDVAYRYFATPRRKFIVADTPGHEQYTRNMVTGASTADAAIILIDITRVTFAASADGLQASLLTQTRRHSAIAAKLGLATLVFAVNKMDLVAFDREKFAATAAAVHDLARQLGIAHYHLLPVSALTGDNIVSASAATPWYAGPPLLSLLESLPTRRAGHAHTLDSPAENTFRFPVQYVARHDGHRADDFRGYMGRIERGQIACGDRIRVLPGGDEAEVTAILLGGEAIGAADSGQCITLQLDRDLDISRGDQLVAAGAAIAPSRQLQAEICWLDREALNPARKYWLKHTTRSVQARITAVGGILDVHTLSGQDADSGRPVGMNDLASVELQLAQPIVADLYRNCRATGSFILIDPASHQTVAAGMISALA